MRYAHGVATPDVVNDFEAWAIVCARLHGMGDAEHRAVVGALGVAEQWRNAEANWAGAIVADIAELRLKRVEILARAYARELAARRAAPSSTPDFRHRATFGARDSRPRPSQIGGTPFSSDPLDHVATHRLHKDDLLAHLRALGSEEDESED
jgi:hypothetical protein